MFYFLDENKLSTFKKKKKKQEISGKIPNFNHFYNDLDSLYSNLSSFKSINFSCHFKKSLKGLFISPKKNLVFNPCQKEEEISRKILIFIKKMLVDNIIDYIPKFPIYDKENVIIFINILNLLLIEL